MSKKVYSYNQDASKSMHGNMIFTTCHKKITEGMYRVRETRDAFLSQHRNCTHEDPRWADIDKEIYNFNKREMDLAFAAQEFYNKWGILDLEEYVEIS